MQLLKLVFAAAPLPIAFFSLIWILLSLAPDPAVNHARWAVALMAGTLLHQVIRTAIDLPKCIDAIVHPNWRSSVGITVGIVITAQVCFALFLHKSLPNADLLPTFTLLTMNSGFAWWQKRVAASPLVDGRDVMLDVSVIATSLTYISLKKIFGFVNGEFGLGVALASFMAQVLNFTFVKAAEYLASRPVPPADPDKDVV